MPGDKRLIVEEESVGIPVETQATPVLAEHVYGTRAAVHDTVDEIVHVRRRRPARLVVRIVDFVFIMIYGLLIIRLLLGMFGARSSAGFVQLIRDVTDPFYSPFKGILPSPTSAEGFTLAFPIIAALVVYMLLHGAIHLFLRMFVHRKTVA
jgi:uncharacterized protein YggT (Ycf19 family)